MKNSILRLVPVLIWTVSTAAYVNAQGLKQPHHPPPPGERGSPNMHVLSHIPLGEPESVSDIEIEQDMSRPYAYVARREGSIGYDVIDLSDPAHAR
ncbi:MAG: hypothetical protein WBW88_07045, partial [Rhodothermales bacterium]